MLNNAPEKNLFKKKFQLSSNLLFRGSSTIKSNNLFKHLDSSKTNYPRKNYQINTFNKFNSYLSGKKTQPLKVFYSENKLNKIRSNNSQKTKLIRTIMSYNNINNRKQNLLKTEHNKKIKSTNTNYFEITDNKSKTSSFSNNISKSSDKSSSFFLTGNQKNPNNNNYNYSKNFRRMSIVGSKSIVDNFGNLVDPLIIPEEDKIFDELNKYNAITDRYSKKNKSSSLFKSIISKKEKTVESTIDDLKSLKSEKEKEIKDKIIKRNKNALNNFSKTFYNQDHFKLTIEDKELLDTLYLTSEDYFDKLDKIKKGKKNKQLKDYQNELLDLIKPVISVYGFEKLKNKFDDINRQNRLDKVWDFEYLKSIEKNEEMIINDINYLYNKYLSNENNKSNYFSKYNPKNFKLELPNLEFKRVLNIEDKEETEMKEFLKKKNNKITFNSENNNINIDANLKKPFNSNLFKSILKSNFSKKNEKNKIKKIKFFIS